MNTYFKTINVSHQSQIITMNGCNWCNSLFILKRDNLVDKNFSRNCSASCILPIRISLRLNSMFLKTYLSRILKSGEYGGCGNNEILFSLRKSRVSLASWGRALSCIIVSMFGQQKSKHFLSIKKTYRSALIVSLGCIISNAYLPWKSHATIFKKRPFCDRPYILSVANLLGL